MLLWDSTWLIQKVCKAQIWSDPVESPQVFVTDDFNNWTGHLLTIQIDSLQQGLQPAHVTLNVGVEEGENITWEEGKQIASVQKTQDLYIISNS